MTLDDFFVEVDNDELKIIDRAVAILWFAGRGSEGRSSTTAEISNVIERHGYARPNVTRLEKGLSSDRRVVRAGKIGWGLSPRARRDINEKFEAVLRIKKKAPPSDSVLPRELFHDTRPYLEKVVHQINASYDLSLYDCCAVMCRRLLETLIIEVYESQNRDDEIKNKRGNFYMFADLLNHLESDATFNLSRNAKQGLKDFKRLGDLSAHNRRHNAVQNDIDRVRNGIREASGELLVMAGLTSQTN